MDLQQAHLTTARDRWLGIANEARRSASPYWEMVGRMGSASAAMQLGEFDAANDALMKAATLADDQCDQLNTLLIQMRRAYLLGLRGGLESSCEQLADVVERATGLGAVLVIGPAVTLQGQVYRRLERHEEADDALERGERVLRATEQRRTLAVCLSERALNALVRGDLESARNHVAGAGMAATLTEGVLLERERVHCAIGRVAEIVGDRTALAAARRQTIRSLEAQARLLRPQQLGRWVAVAPRAEVIGWADWTPSLGS